MKILIIEDHEAWGTKLRDMYEQILGGSDDVVRIANSYEKAENALKDRKQEWDLISLDINLGDANGLDLLEIAYEKNWVKGAVVISGIMLDKGPVSIEATKLKRMRHTLPQEVEKAFPGTFLLSKNPLSYSSDIDSINAPEIIGKIVEDFKKDLTAELLNELASPSYILDVSEAEYDPIEPKIYLKSPRRKPILMIGNYARLLYLLARKSKTNENYGRVSKEELKSIFFNISTTQSAFDAVKRHLTNKGIKIDSIIEGSIKTGLSLIAKAKVDGIDRNFQSNYTLIVDQGYGADDIGVSIKFRRNKKAGIRKFFDRDALFLWELAVKQNSIEVMSAQAILKVFEPNFISIDESTMLNKAREKISQFEHRLRSSDEPLEPYRIIRSNSKETGWRLNADVKVEGLKNPVHVISLEPDRLSFIKTQKPKQNIDSSDIQESIDDFATKHLDFINRHVGCFSEWEIELAMAIHNRVSAEDIAEDHGRETDEIEDEMQALEKKWHDLGGPALK